MVGIYTLIAPSAQIQGADIGNFCEIRANCRIGEGTRLGSGCILSAGTIIGKNCQIHKGFTSTDHAGMMTQRSTPAIIEDNVITGVNVSVAPGIVIGKGAVIGAHSYVKTNVPAGEVWAGTPAKRIK